MYKSGTYTCRIDGTAVSYQLTKRKRQKYVNIKISRAGEVRVSAPNGASLSHIENVLHQKSGWILKHTQTAHTMLQKFDPETSVLYFGKRYPVKVEYNSACKKNKVLIKNNKIVVEKNNSDTTLTLKCIGDFLEKEARTEISKKIEQYAGLMGITYNRIAFRSQKTRWGSSSGKGNLNFNWRIIMAPDKVQNYLVIHELGHQKHRNHSHAFWDFVSYWCPEYKECDTWLKNHAVILGLF